jgi:hypothetical protein
VTLESTQRSCSVPLSLQFSLLVLGEIGTGFAMPWFAYDQVTEGFLLTASDGACSPLFLLLSQRFHVHALRQASDGNQLQLHHNVVPFPLAPRFSALRRSLPCFQPTSDGIAPFQPDCNSPWHGSCYARASRARKDRAPALEQKPCHPFYRYSGIIRPADMVPCLHNAKVMPKARNIARAIIVSRSRYGIILAPCNARANAPKQKNKPSHPCLAGMKRFLW